MRLQAIVHNATNGEQCDLSFHHGTLFFSMVAMNQVTKLIQINQRQASHLACLNHWAPYSPQSLCSSAWEETCDKHGPSHSCRSDINGCIFLQQQDDDAKCSVLNECPLIRFRRSSLPSVGRNLLTHNALVHSTFFPHIHHNVKELDRHPSNKRHWHSTNQPTNLWPSFGSSQLRWSANWTRQPATFVRTGNHINDTDKKKTPGRPWTHQKIREKKPASSNVKKNNPKIISSIILNHPQSSLIHWKYRLLENIQEARPFTWRFFFTWMNWEDGDHPNTSWLIGGIFIYIYYVCNWLPRLGRYQLQKPEWLLYNLMIAWRQLVMFWKGNGILVVDIELIKEVWNTTNLPLCLWIFLGFQYSSNI